MNAVVVGALVVRIRRLERARMFDGKTGVLTFASWEILAARELSRSRRERRPVALLMVDIDGFKKINDSAGHQRGDAVLAAVGTSLGAVLRGYDLVARFGGDEFVALIPDVDAESAAAIADRLRARVDAACGVATSIGIACSVAPDVTTDDLIGRADAALYAAKAAGGDQVAVADDLGP